MHRPWGLYGGILIETTGMKAGTPVRKILRQLVLANAPVVKAFAFRFAVELRQKK